MHKNPDEQLGEQKEEEHGEIADSGICDFHMLHGKILPGLQYGS